MKKKAMKDYLSNIFDQEKNKLFINAGDSKKTEEKERVELEQELAEERKIKNVLGTPESVSPKKVDEKIKRENREQKLDIPQLEEAISASASGKGEVREETKKALHPLENYRKSIYMEGSRKLYYFQNNGKNIIDIVSLIHHITEILSKVKTLYKQLSQEVSPREKFYLKQDAINNQYTLKDLIKKSVKMCTQESYAFPDYTIDIINIQRLQEIVDILETQNWSKENEFKTFIYHIESLTKTFNERMTPPEAYMISVFRNLQSEDPQRKPSSFARVF